MRVSFNSLKCLFSKTQTIVFNCRKLSSSLSEHAANSTEFLSEPSSNQKLLKVAIIGLPNAGKSTFINKLMDRKVFATSQRVHTTRVKAKAIFSSEDTQIIFVDTPGLVNEREQKKFKLTPQFINDGREVAKHADIIGVIHDVSCHWTKDRLDIKIVRILESNKEKPSFLVLNKVDDIKSKRKLLDITRNVTENSLDGKPIEHVKRNYKKEDNEYKGWAYFSDIFMVSALTGDGMDDVRNYLVSKAKPGQWLFPEAVWTDQNTESVIINTVKAALLNFMPQEVPYKLQPIIEYLNVDEGGKIVTVVIVKCPTQRISKLLLGHSEGRLRNITEYVQRELQECFYSFVKIKIVPHPLPDETSQ
ncbi:unnamed protein product [Phyllotreta striolata]|uniref:GTPase Era, mitochondrial n=1 Tax=Phyllotreta striolata TaxID=444603 RepID=A0A9N9TYS6_PHYSR|nr:unnamed protein product [Phyllotreta striolata]